MIRLIQEFGAHAGRQFSFNQPRVRIGRAPDNDVPFDANVDLDASGHHCDVVFEADGYVLVDGGSRNGTFVNSTRISRQRLAQGDLIECGNGGPRLRVDFGFGPAPATSWPPGAVSARGIGSAPGTPGSSSAVPVPMLASGFSAAGIPASAPGLASGPIAFPASAPGVPSPGLSGPGISAPGAFAPVPPPSAPGVAIIPARASASDGGTQVVSMYGSTPPGSAPGVLAAPMPVTPGTTAGGGSVGSAMAAGIPEDGKVGKRTVAMMIDTALAQNPAGVSTGLKFLVVALTALVVGGLGVGGYLLWNLRRDVDGRAGETGSAERIAARYAGAVHLLVAELPGQAPRGFCTAFAVSMDLLATNAHCVDQAQAQLARGAVVTGLRSHGRGARVGLSAVYRDGRFRDARFGLGGTGYDVGLFRVTYGGPLAVQVRLASDVNALALHPGTTIYVYGFPGVNMNTTSPVATLTSGLVNQVTDFFGQAAEPALGLRVQHTAETSAGSAGSPVLLANGTVIAVNAGSLADDERQTVLDPRTGERVRVEVNRSSNFKYGMRVDLLRQALLAVGQVVQ